MSKPAQLTQRNVGRRRYRVFEATEGLDLFTGLERALAGPTGDTQSDRPIRREPNTKRHKRRLVFVGQGRLAGMSSMARLDSPGDQYGELHDFLGDRKRAPTHSQ
jgi:hypothetical protein